MSSAELQCGRHHLNRHFPQVMGILNVTPDSFYDGGQLWQSSGIDKEELLVRAAAMVEAGASILDVGGESTRPGAEPVSIQQELDRVIPAVELITRELDVVVSVDTSNPQVMAESAKAGCGMLNDVRALGRDGALQAAAATQLPICLMHMQGQPQTMQAKPQYFDVVEGVKCYLQGRIQACVDIGIDRQRLLLDPGFGFGKTLEHNLQLLNRLSEFEVLNVPLLVGVSRKSMVGAVLDKPVDQRLYGSLAAAVVAVSKGAWILRVHDVEATQDVVRMTMAIQQEAVK